MKSLYQCEKCGKLFESWDECNRCECSHATPMIIDSYNLPDSSKLANKLMKYEDGNVLPSVISVLYYEHDEDGNCKHDENGVNIYGVAQYVLSHKSTSFLDKLRDEVNEREVQRQEEQRLWLENYQKEQEEKRKAEETENTETTEEDN